MQTRRWLKLAATLMIAALGGGLAAYLGVPAAWLSGAMAAVTIASIAGFDTRLPLHLVDTAFLLIGVTLGAGFTPAFLNNLAAWPLSLALLAVSVVCVVAGVRGFLVHVSGWDRDTAFFSAVPGAMSYVLAVASQTSADMRMVATCQSLRVLLLVAVLPGLVVAFEGEPVVATDAVTATPGEIAALIVAGIVVAVIFRRLKVPAAFMTGALAASGVLHGTGLTVGTLPQPVVVVAFICLGALIGSRFFGTDLWFLRKIAVASFGAFLVATAVAFALAMVAVAVTGLSTDQVIIAFAPGGLDAMVALALALNLDSAYVAAHQLARFAGIGLVLPLVAWRVIGRERKARADRPE